MDRKKKKCKGIGKAKDSGCGEIKYPHRYGLCSPCFGEWLYSTPNGKSVLNKSIITGKNKVKAEKKRKDKEKKEALKTIAQLIQDARRPFQKLIRMRDQGKQCICCGIPLPYNISGYDGGHLFSAEKFTGLIFHPDNVHGQSIKCNKYDYGNSSGYLTNLPNRIGQERVDNLKKLSAKLREYNWGRQELIDLKNYYNKELRLVEKGEKNINDVDLNVGIVTF
jgi:hypothetical protein